MALVVGAGVTLVIIAYYTGRDSTDAQEARAVQVAVSSPEYPVTVPEQLAPSLRLDPDDVVAIALQQLGDEATIDRVTAMATDASVSLIEPRASRPNPEVQPIGPVWVVRAHGNFVGMRGLRSTPTVANTGYFVILDSDGSIVAMGLP